MRIPTIRSRVRGGMITLAALACVTMAQAQEKPVRFVQETPWTLSALGISEEFLPVIAYWEPSQSRYYLAWAHYLELLGFSVLTDSLQWEALRPPLHLAIDGATGAAETGTDAFRLDSTDYFVSQGALYVSFGGLQRFFLPGSIRFDRARLHITHAEAAPQLARPPAGPAPLRYGRSRPLWGDTHLDYRITRTQWQQYEATYHGFLRTHTNALGGRLLAEGLFSRVDTTLEIDVRALSYLVDFPRSEWLTQVEAGRLNLYGWPRQATYDGLRLSNRPVADQYIQRQALLHGVAEPGAIITASVGGMHVDRVYADEQGNYAVRIPAYYGSSQAHVEIAPVDGGPTRTRIHHLFVSRDLPPPGTFYWDARVGRDMADQDALLLLAEARYGITPTFAARAAYVQLGTPRPQVGLTKNWRGLSADAEVALPMEAGRMRLWAQHHGLRLQAEAAFSEKDTGTYYRRNLGGYLGWQRTRSSLFLHATRQSTFEDTHHTSLTGSATASLSRTMHALVTAGLSRLQWTEQEAEPWKLRWNSTLTRTLARGMRIGLQGEGGRASDLEFVGATLHGQWRWASLGLRLGYDRGMAASFTLRFDTPWASITNRSALGAETPQSHSQSMYGSMALGRTPRMTRQTQARSSALLQAFLDTDRDGRKDADEAYLEDVDIQVAHAQVRQISPGMVRADLLVPHQYYQVTVDPRSLKNPRLALTPGERFSFVADPGQTKRIDIAVQEQTVLDGTLDELPPFAASRLVVLFLQEDTEIARAEVSQEGRFSARLAPGTYRVTLKDLFEVVDLSGYQQHVEVLNQPEQALRLNPFPSDDS